MSFINMYESSDGSPFTGTTMYDSMIDGVCNKMNDITQENAHYIGTTEFMKGFPMEFTSKSDIPPMSNPFHYDMDNMGTKIGSNVHVMFPNHEMENCPYLIIIHIPSGKQIRIRF